jgi:hypothetical protein
LEVRLKRHIFIPVAVFLFGWTSVCLAAEPAADTKECIKGAGFAEASKVARGTAPSISPPASVPPGKARIFFFWRGSKMRSWKGAHVSLAIDGEWKAILPAKNTYMWFESDPGSLDLCGFSGGGVVNNHGHMTLMAEAGRTYYIEGSPGGDLAGRLAGTVRAVSESEGTKAIAESELAQITFDGFSGKKFDEGWRALHAGLLPEEVFELLGRKAPPEIRPNSDSKWGQDGYKFAFAKGKLRSWSKPEPYIFKVKQ